MITDAKAEEWLLYLADTDEEYGRQAAHVEALSHQLKTQKAIEFLAATGTVAERQAKADSSQKVIALIEEHSNAVGDRETTRAQRKTREIGIEMWRTQASNRRAAGQV